MLLEDVVNGERKYHRSFSSKCQRTLVVTVVLEKAQTGILTLYSDVAIVEARRIASNTDTKDEY